MATQPKSSRTIGTWGTGARALAGAAALGGAVLVGVDALDAVLGLVVFPLAVVAVLYVRGADASALRLTSPEWCCLNIAMGAAAFILVTEAAMLFVGASMLVAAARGDGGCEVFAVSNWLRNRDDQLACPVFSPIDAAERRAHSTAG